MPMQHIAIPTARVPSKLWPFQIGRNANRAAQDNDIVVPVPAWLVLRRSGRFDQVSREGGWTTIDIFCPDLGWINEDKSYRISKVNIAQQRLATSIPSRLAARISVKGRKVNGQAVWSRALGRWVWQSSKKA